MRVGGSEESVVISVSRFSLLRLNRKTFTAAIAATIVFSLISLGVIVANAAIGALSQLSISIVTDGTTPFDADNSAGNDSSAQNGILRTMDYITYQWDFAVSTSGDVTLTQTLPDGMRWDASSTADCSQGAAGISTDKKTLTCTIPNLTAGSLRSKNVKAQALTSANGATLATQVSGGGQTSNTVAATLSATPKLNFEHMFGGASRATFNAQPGYLIQTIQNISMPIDTASGKGVRGLESFNGSTLSFTVTPKNAPAGAVLHSCSAGSPDGSRQPSTVQGSAYAVVNAGTWTCSQPNGPGTAVNVTVTGVDTSLSYWPTKYVTNTSIPATIAYVAAGGVAFWYPETALPTGAVHYVQTQATAFDPVSASGVSNFGSSYSGNQQPNANCVTTFPSNCATTSVNLRDITFSSWVFQNIPGASTNNSGDGTVYPNQSVTFTGTTTSGQFNPNLVNQQHCYTFDNTLWNISPNGVPADPKYEVEYGTHSYADDTARKTANCGVEGDGAAGWFASPSAAGGTNKVTAVRIRMVNTVTYGQAVSTSLPLVRLAGVAAGTKMGVFLQHQADQYTARKSNYDPSTHASFATGSRGIAADARVSISLAASQTTTRPGTSLQITATPKVTNPHNSASAVTAKNVNVQITMPSTCESYVPGSSVPSPTSITPANLGADGIACTADDVSPETLIFELGDLSSSATITPITFSVNVDIKSPTPVKRTYVSTIESVSDPSRLSLRQASVENTVSVVGEFTVSKQASVAKAIDGVPFTYTIGWVNSLANGVGLAKIVDVLPFDGDSRGSTQLGALNLLSASTTTAGVTMQYTTEPHASLEAAVAADPSGDTGVNWVSTMPNSGVTGVRIVITSLPSVGTGSATLKVSASGMNPDTLIVNTVNAKTSSGTSGLVGTSRTEVRSFASKVTGNVYFDNDYSFGKNAGDSALANTTVSFTGYKFGLNGVNDNGIGDDIAVTTPISVMTNAQGEFTFNSVDAGKYTFSTATPAGHSVAQHPTSAIVVSESTTISDVNFGFMVTIPTPVAVDDQYTLATGSQHTLNPLQNDTFDPSGVITAVTAASSGGSVTIAADGTSVMYNPATGFAGTETFQYTITDKARQTATATVTVTVLGAPNAIDDTVTMVTQTLKTIIVTANDNGTAIAVTAVTTNAQTNGTVSVSANGQSIDYRPNNGFYGVASFSYTITDQVGQTDTATVVVRVYPVLGAKDDQAHTGLTFQGAGVPVIIPILANDSGNQISFVSNTPPSNGSVSGPDSSMNVTYTPNDGFAGTDTFSYTITDPAGQTSSATVTVTVSHPPTLVDDSVKIRQNTPVNIEVLANDIGTSLTVTQTSSMTVTSSGTPAGVAKINADGTITFTPATGFSGLATFEYTATDSFLNTLTAQVNVVVVAAPIAHPFTVSALEQHNTLFNVLEYVDVPPGSSILLDSVTQPGKGEINIVNTQGDVEYVPEAGNTGQTTFSYVAIDDMGQTTTATVTVNIVAAPVAEDDEKTTGYEQPVTLNLLSNDSGSTPIALAVIFKPRAEGGTVVQNGNVIQFIPEPGFDGDVIFSYKIEDEWGQYAWAEVRVRVLAPLSAEDYTDETDQNVKIQLHIPLHPDASFDSFAPADGGSIEIDANGDVWFIPASGFTGSYVTQYRVIDSYGNTASANVTITVKANVSPKPFENGGNTFQTLLAYTGIAAQSVAIAHAAVFTVAGVILLAAQRWRRRKHTDA